MIRSSAARLLALAFALSPIACDQLVLEPTPIRDAEPRVPVDGGVAPDTGVLPRDAGSSDAGEVSDAGEAPDGGSDAGLCPHDELGDADKPRVVLIGHPFGAVAGQQGTEVRSLSLSADGALRNDGRRLDVGVRPARITFAPSGAYALVLGDRDTLVSVRVDSASQLEVVDTVALPGAGYGDMHFLADGSTAFVVGTNVDHTGGISTVHLGCNGELRVVESAFYNLRLADSLAFLPGQDRAVVLGGQTVFEPVDPMDVRLLARSGGRWSEVGAFDLWGDFTDASRIAVSPDGRTLLMPNGSPFSKEGHQVMVAQIEGDEIRLSHRLMGMADAREAIFSPDGQTALVTLLEPGAVVVLADRGTGFREVERIRNIGLPEQMAMVRRGRLAGRVLIPSVDARGGPNVAQLQIEAAGQVRDLGQLDLTESLVDIPGAIDVQP